MKHLLLGISGGIAAYKTPDLVRRLQRDGWTVGVALTPAATRFVSPLALQAVADHTVMTDMFAAEGEGIGHIDLADWAELMVVAPATAQTLARLAHGFADDPVSLAWLATRARRVAFPAMNVNMWSTAAVRRNVEILRADGATVVDPAAGELACGWVGPGRMPDPPDIVEFCRSFRRNNLSGKTIVVNAGPTREWIDPVRFLSNPSSGRMGFALAELAALRGADVTLVAGPCDLPTPTGVRRIDVGTAAEMHAATLQACTPTVDVLIAAAAVADYTPAERADTKTKKTDAPRSLDLVRTRDILADVVAQQRPRLAVGFAAETNDVLAYARAKLARKDLDLIVANRVGGEHGGFADTRNQVWLLDREGGELELPLADKRQVADRILDAITSRLAALPT